MKKTSSLLLALVFILTSCGPDCNKLNYNFVSYQEAISTLRESDFALEEKIKTASSWIESLEYYSCDKKIGYLILETKKGKTYIHDNLPIMVWKQFKKSDSYGAYYNTNIKGRYRLIIK